MHELTEKIGPMVRGLPVATNRIITEWLEEKAKVLWGAGRNADSVRKILGLIDKSLVEKMDEYGLKCQELAPNMKDLAGMAKQHFKDHPEELA